MTRLAISSMGMASVLPMARMYRWLRRDILLTEKRNSIHTFFDYYLPTTQKLLDTYADFEETGVEGENLREAKERIEQTRCGPRRRRYSGR